ncbi:MAG TPA: hypothetical protein VJR27_00930 [Candidatus Saccharimonadales bacterium]|nr:hypothetical protein [Candidatus Saccharimonadales bacterium]
MQFDKEKSSEQVAHAKLRPSEAEWIDQTIFLSEDDPLRGAKEALRRKVMQARREAIKPCMPAGFFDGMPELYRDLRKGDEDYVDSQGSLQLIFKRVEMREAEETHAKDGKTERHTISIELSVPELIILGNAARRTMEVAEEPDDLFNLPPVIENMPSPSANDQDLEGYLLELRDEELRGAISLLTAIQEYRPDLAP